MDGIDVNVHGGTWPRKLFASLRVCTWQMVARGQWNWLQSLQTARNTSLCARRTLVYRQKSRSFPDPLSYHQGNPDTVKCGGRVWGETWNRYVFCLQILNNFSLESCNEGELNLKSQMIGIPDKKILISFRNLMSWERRGEQKKATEDGNNGAGEMRRRVREGKTRNGEKRMKRLSNERNLLHIVNLKLITVNKNHLMNKFKA